MEPKQEVSWELTQLAAVGTFVGSHNTAEVLGDVRAIVEEVARGDGPLADACRRRLALVIALTDAGHLA
jgi:hypothetical protein